MSRCLSSAKVQKRRPAVGLKRERGDDRSYPAGQAAAVSRAGNALASPLPPSVRCGAAWRVHVRSRRRGRLSRRGVREPARDSAKEAELDWARARATSDACSTTGAYAAAVPGTYARSAQAPASL